MFASKPHRSGEIVDLYAHRWEIELGYREMKQHMLESRFTLRSNLPELINQELWGAIACVQSHSIQNDIDGEVFEKRISEPVEF